MIGARGCVEGDQYTFGLVFGSVFNDVLVEFASSWYHEYGPSSSSSPSSEVMRGGCEGSWAVEVG